MVATGISPAIAEMRLWSITGGPTCWKPRGTVCKILMGYLPEALLRCLQYNQDAIVRMTMTNAFRKTEMKKNSRSTGVIVNFREDNHAMQ